ncbi:MAG: acetate/propionate family kinase [Caldilineaceae bacterium]|nr:acetate/propionate family kinase [Caldilineaceae bacterium]
MTTGLHVLTINSGSSSLKFALYQIGAMETRLFAGELERIGLDDGRFAVHNDAGQPVVDQPLALPNHEAALQQLLGWLASTHPNQPLAAVGHRLVHGGAAFVQPHLITTELLAKLSDIMPLAPDHLPQEIKAIEAIRQAHPTLPQVACFDTAFHRTMPRQAQMFALPRKFWDADIRRYGFHGLSYEYIMQALADTAGESAANGRLIIAHLGNGASMAAVHHGQSVDTTMGLTPLGGLVMGTRSGDLDPGVLLYLLETKGLSPTALDQLLNQESGLLGVSARTSDMRELLAHAQDDEHAAEAITLFCYQARKTIGALSAVLGGLDTLIFTGGIGENAPVVRQHICENLAFLGIEIDDRRNTANAAIISPEIDPDKSTVTVRVIRTDEDRMIARHTVHTLMQRQKSLDLPL